MTFSCNTFTHLVVPRTCLKSSYPSMRRLPCRVVEVSTRQRNVLVAGVGQVFDINIFDQNNLVEDTINKRI